VTILHALETSKIFPGAICSALDNQTGIWKVATIEKVYEPT